MEKIPQGRYTKEFREEAARLVIENGMSVGLGFFLRKHTNPRKASPAIHPQRSQKSGVCLQNLLSSKRGRRPKAPPVKGVQAF